MSENSKKDRTKTSVFSLVLAAILIAVVLISVQAVLHKKPPATVQSLMTELNVPAEVSVDDGMREAVQESFQNEFSALYGIDLTPDESAFFSKLLQSCASSFDMEPYLSEALEQVCSQRRISRESMIHQLMEIRDPAEREKIREEWTTAGQTAILRSEEFLRTMEPVYRQFYDWWTPRHPEYEGVASGIKLTNNHEELVNQIAVSLRRELIVHTAQQLSKRLETDLRKHGKALSDAKLQQAFALFLRLGKERYTDERIRKMANALVTEAELTDDEIVHCMLLKDRRLSEERLETIQEIQMRYLTASTQDQIHAETVSALQKELQEITGLEYAQ